MTTFGLSADGFTAARQADYLTLIRDDYEARLRAAGYTVMPDWERDLFLGSISEIMAWLLGLQSEVGQAIYDARVVGNATGLQLDNLAVIVGVRRQEATASTVRLTCYGDDGTVITAGKICEGGGDDDSARWVIAEDGVIAGGFVYLTATCDTTGAVVATAGEITTIVTPVDGWDSVTNTDADPGRDQETDGALRSRRQAALATAGSTSPNAILSALLELEFVTGATVVDNPTGTSAVVDGITVDPYGVAAVVSPATLTADQQASVLQAIFDHLGAGTAISGSVSGTVTKRDGRTHAVRYSVAADSTVALAWVLTLDPGYVVGDVDDALEDLVADYFLQLDPGDTVYPMPLIALAATIDGIANVDSLTLNGGSTSVTHTALQQPVKGTHTVA